MSRLFYTPINLNNLELQNAVIGNLSTSSINAISGPTSGRVQYDSTLNVMKYYNGSAWITVADTNDTITIGGTSVAIGGTTGVSGTRISDLYVNGANFTGTVTVPNPTNSTDAANKAYVDSAVVGIDWKPSVLLASTTNVSLADSGTALTLDGVTVADGNRILIKDQSTQTANGIYTVSNDGGGTFSYTRSLDADTGTEVTGGLAVFVEGGNTQADTGWVLSTPNGSATIGSSNLIFTQFTGVGSLVAGAGLTKTGNTVAVGAGTGITVNADDVAVNFGALYVGTSNVQSSSATQALAGISSITGTTTLTLASNTDTGTSGYDLTIAAGNTTNTGNARGGDVSITGGNQTAGTDVSAVGGGVTIAGGTSTSGTGGEVIIRGGDSTSGTDGAVTIGATNTSSVTIGASGIAVKLPGVGTSGFVKLGSGGTLSADTGVYATKAAGTISLTGGSGGTITHNLNTRAVLVQMYETTSSLPTNLVEMDVVSATVNTVTVTSSTSGTFYYVVIG
jgi:hypothetical protein